MSKPQKDNEKGILKVIESQTGEENRRELRITMIKRCFNGAIERFINLEAEREVKCSGTFSFARDFDK